MENRRTRKCEIPLSGGDGLRPLAGVEPAPSRAGGQFIRRHVRSSSLAALLSLPTLSDRPKRETGPEGPAPTIRRPLPTETRTAATLQKLSEVVA
jgi:hypothetical protein